MQLFVRGQNLHTFDVTGTESVQYLKNEISFAEGISVDERVLFYAGRPLEDELSLEDCGVVDLATLEVGLRLHGGITLNRFVYILPDHFFCFSQS